MKSPARRTIKKKFFQLSAVKICGFYICIGLAWILFSDSFVFLITTTDDQRHWLSTIKGFLYVLVTALILYGLIRYYIGEIEERQMLYQGVVENAGSIIIKTDNNLNIIVFNEYAEQVFHKAAETVLGTSLEELLTVADRISGEWKNVFTGTRMVTDGPSWSFEMEYLNPEEHSLWILWTVTRGKRKDEPGYSLLLVGTDISEQKSAEKSLSIINRAIQTISECNQAIIHETDEERLLQAVCRLMVGTGGHRIAWIGYTRNDDPDALVQMAYAGYDEEHPLILPSPHDTGASDSDLCKTVIQTGAVQVRRYQLPPADEPFKREGIAREYAASVYLPLKNDTRVFGVFSIYSPFPESFQDKETMMLAGLAEDISFAIQAIRTRNTLIAAQQELAQSEERFRLAMEATNDGLWDWDIQTGAAFCSPRYAGMLGYEPHDLPESFATWVSLVHPDDAAMVNRKLDYALRNGTEYAAEFRMKTKSGGWKWILSRGIVVSWDAGKTPLRMVGTNIDIAERKETEQELKHTAQELRDAMHQIDLNLTTLSALNDKIRNPLTVIMILSEDSNTKNREEIMSQIDAIDDMIKELDKGWIESEKVRTYLNKHHGLFE